MVENKIKEIVKILKDKINTNNKNNINNTQYLISFFMSENSNKLKINNVISIQTEEEFNFLIKALRKNQLELIINSLKDKKNPKEIVEYIKNIDREVLESLK